MLRTICTQVATILGLMSATACMHPQHGSSLGSERGIRVQGSGEAKGAPDIARSSLGIEVRAATAEQAVAEAGERMQRVIAALKSAGVAQSDIRTRDLSVSFERDFTPPPEPAGGAPAQDTATRGSYRVSNVLEVVLRNLAAVSTTLGAATNAGANNIWGIEFDLADRTPLHQKARELAVLHARANAAQLAQLTGVKLGRVLAVDDQPSSSGPMYPAGMRAMAEGDASRSATPVESGQLTITHQVQIVYALE